VFKTVQHLAARSGLFLLSAAVGSIITIIIAHAWGYLGKTAALPEQLNTILTDASKQGLEPTYIRDVDLRGTGETQRLVVLRARMDLRPQKRSDELRLYALLGQSWHLVYHARPLALNAFLPYTIKIMGIGSFDSTDREEAILRLEPNYADSELPRPVALLWSLSKQAYELRSLLPHAPELSHLRGALAEAGPQAFAPADVPLASGGRIASAGAAPWIAVTRSRLAAAYPLEKTCNGCSGLWEIKVFCINFQRPALAGLEALAVDSGGDIVRDRVRLPGHGETVEPKLQAVLRRPRYCD
jgi:hypothetical protein